MTRLLILALPQSTLPSDLHENCARGVAQTGRFAAHDHYLTQTAHCSATHRGLMCHGWRSLRLVLLRHLCQTSTWYLTILSAECPLTLWQFQHQPLLHLAQSAQKIAAEHLPLAPTMPCHQLLAYEAAHFCRISCCMSWYTWDSHCCWSTNLAWRDAVGTLLDSSSITPPFLALGWPLRAPALDGDQCSPLLLKCASLCCTCVLAPCTYSDCLQSRRRCAGT